MIPLPPAFLDRPIAHRALHDIAQGWPENSRAAITAAIDAGYGVEVDLQLSADGEAMVFHDYALKRLTGRAGPVRQHEASELARIPLLGGDEGIPTLAEVLALTAGRAPLLIEIKDQDGAMGTNVGPLEEATARALHGYDGPVALMSFNPNSVAAMAELAPNLPRGLTTCAFPAKDWLTLDAGTRRRLRGLPDLDRVGASFISHNHKHLNTAPVAAVKDRGLPVLCWTIRSPAEEAQARKIADNITFERYAA